MKNLMFLLMIGMCLTSCCMVETDGGDLFMCPGFINRMHKPKDASTDKRFAVVVQILKKHGYASNSGIFSCGDRPCLQADKELSTIGVSFSYRFLHFVGDVSVYSVRSVDPQEVNEIADEIRAALKREKLM